MTEPHVTEDALAYWNGELTTDRRGAVEAHVSACAACRAEFDAVRVALTALADWPREPGLSPELERRLVASSRRPAALAWARRIAAVLVLALVGGAGFVAGRSTTSIPVLSPAPVAVDTTLNTYLLLLEEGEWPLRQPVSREGYRAWAGALRREHRLVSAEKLTDEGGFRVRSDGQAVRPEGSERAAHLSGWFLLRARSYDEAIELARRGPHLRHGSVLVRQVE